MLNMITLVNSYNYIEGDTAVAIGKFDGLHIGHDLILKKLASFKKQGIKTVLLSFDPSPDVFFWRMEDTEILSQTEMEEKLYHAICQFAKRQETWFRGMQKKGAAISWLPCVTDKEERFKAACEIIEKNVQL